MSADDKARKLAEKMAEAAAYPGSYERILPYAKAILAAEEGLTRIKENCEDECGCEDHTDEACCLRERGYDDCHSCIAGADLSTIKGLLP